jgi:NAD/NADP transhydrogenase alpha subunit
MLKGMQAGSVLVDISDRPGGCFETSRPTTWKEPTYVEEGVTHFCRHQHAGGRAADQLAGDLRGDPAVGEQAGLR